MVLLGRNDVDLSSYKSLSLLIQRSLSPDVCPVLLLRNNVDGVGPTLEQLKISYNASQVVWVAHSMSSAGAFSVLPENVHKCVLQAFWRKTTFKSDPGMSWDLF